MMFGLLMKMKRKMMVAEAFVLFFLLQLNSMVEDRPLMCSEIDIHNVIEYRIFRGTRVLND